MKGKKRTKTKINVTLLLLLLIVLFLLVLGVRCTYLGDAKQRIEVGDEQIVEIADSDYEKQQEVLNTIVEKGKMNVNYSSKAIFRGMNSEKFNVKNIKNNHYPIIFELYDEHNRCIYVSRELNPGYEMNGIQLQSKLSKGVHECKLKIGYTQEGNVSSVFPITIEVK